MFLCLDINCSLSRIDARITKTNDAWASLPGNSDLEVD